MAPVTHAHAAAAEIFDAFTLYQRSFKRITRCAKGRFEQRDWHGHERDSVARLDLYKRVVDRCVYDTRNILGAPGHRPPPRPPPATIPASGFAASSSWSPSRCATRASW